MSSRCLGRPPPSKATLAFHLAEREPGVTLVTFAPLLIAAQPAVRDTAISMSNHAFRRDLVPANACLKCGSRGATDLQMVQIHASGIAAGVLQLGSVGNRPSAQLVDPKPSRRDGCSRCPLAMPAGIAFDPLPISTAMRHRYRCYAAASRTPARVTALSVEVCNVVRLWCLLRSVLLWHIDLEAQASVEVAASRALHLALFGEIGAAWSTAPGHARRGRPDGARLIRV